MNSITEWAAALREKLIALEGDYEGYLACHRGEPWAFDLRYRLDDDCEPIDAARIQATKALGAILEALLKLPEFQEPRGNGLHILRSITVALLDLDSGNRPPLLDTRKSRRAAEFDDAERKVGAVVIVELFEATGMKNAPARREAARFLTARGIRGRKGGGVSAQTLHDWQVDIAGSEDPRYINLIATFRAIAAQIPSPTLGQVQELALAIVSSPAFKLRI